jgi:hypothetical protein
MSLGLLDGREGTGSQPDGGVASNQRGRAHQPRRRRAPFSTVRVPGSVSRFSRLCSWSRNSKTVPAPLGSAQAHTPQVEGGVLLGAWQQSRHAIRRHWSLWRDGRIAHCARSAVNTLRLVLIEANLTVRSPWLPSGTLVVLRPVSGSPSWATHAALSLALAQPALMTASPGGADSSCCERFRRLPWLRVLSMGVPAALHACLSVPPSLLINPRIRSSFFPLAHPPSSSTAFSLPILPSSPTTGPPAV